MIFIRLVTKFLHLRSVSVKIEIIQGAAAALKEKGSAGS